MEILEKLNYQIVILAQLDNIVMKVVCQLLLVTVMQVIIVYNLQLHQLQLILLKEEDVMKDIIVQQEVPIK